MEDERPISKARNRFFLRRLKEEMVDWDDRPLFKERHTKTVGYDLTPEEKTLYDEVTSYVRSKRKEAKAIVLKRKLAQEFRDQLTVGIPTNEDESALRCLASQITAQKVVVKLFLRHPLHAKLYLLFRHDPLNPEMLYRQIQYLVQESDWAAQGQEVASLLDAGEPGREGHP